MVTLACFVSYKKGKQKALNEAKQAFKEYNVAHPSLSNILSPGFEAAEHLIEQLEEYI